MGILSSMLLGETFNVLRIRHWLCLYPFGKGSGLGALADFATGFAVNFVLFFISLAVPFFYFHFSSSISASFSLSFSDSSWLISYPCISFSDSSLSIFVILVDAYAALTKEAVFGALSGDTQILVMSGNHVNVACFEFRCLMASGSKL